MNPVTPTIDAGIDELPATRRFDPRRHLRIAGLFDLWLEPGPEGGLVVPTEPSVLLNARGITDLVRRSGEAAHDVRILTSDGTRNRDLFSEVAGLLGHDVLVSPDGADVRHRYRYRRQENAEGGPLHAVPLDRVTRRCMDWVVIQPPDLATPLPGWFAVDRGVVRPRTGLVGLPLPAGLALATRADFVTRRAIAHQLTATSDGLVTVAVTARAEGFLVGDYGGTQTVHGGEQLAALLGDLPLYGSDLRLWVTWPSDPQEQRGLAEQARDLAEQTGATVWTPAPGGSAELVDGGRDLRALAPAGNAGEWHAYRPGSAAGPLALRATPDGLLVPALARVRITVSPRLALPASTPADRPDSAHDPVTVPATALDRPALITESRRAPVYGPAWLAPGQQVNAEEFEAFVVCPVDPARAVAEGVQSAELFLTALLDPGSVPNDTYLLRVRVAPGGAIPMTTLRSHIPARLQHLRGVNDAYLLPAGRLDRVSPLGGFRTYRFGRLLRTTDCADGPLRIHCSSRYRTIAGLPNDVRRWPGFGSRRAYALVPESGSRLPRGWLRLHRKAPPARPGRLLLEVRVPRGRTIDVTSTAEMLAPLTRLRSQAERLRAAGVELIVGSRSYERVQVRRVYRAQEHAWRRVPGTVTGPLPAVLSQVQPPSPTRTDHRPPGTGPTTTGT
ncbi:hypothetical protein ACLQ25_08585 [Micromonospora sp. DT44]|uniref:hypothetical protein n=1 Tax=Micromonospora sp. DT44 TaxID=3393439 RepID=UPI003CF0C61F